MKKRKKNVISLICLIIIILLVMLSSIIFRNENEPKKSKKEEKPDMDIWDARVIISAVVEEKGNYWNIQIIEVTNGHLALDDAQFQLVAKDSSIKFTKKIDKEISKNRLESGYSEVYPIPYNENKLVYENPILGDGEVVDDSSINNPQIWEGCYFTYIDSIGNCKVNPGDFIWLYKDWNNDDIDDITFDCIFKILDFGNDTVMNKKLSDNDGPYNKSLSSINKTQYENYWEIEIKDIENNSLEIEESQFWLISKKGIVKYIRGLFNINEKTILKFNGSTFYIYTYHIYLPIENATIGDGEPIDNESLNKPEYWEECYFVYIDKQNDNKINSGDKIWIFNDWDDDNINDILINDKIYIRNDKNFEIIIFISFN